MLHLLYLVGTMAYTNTTHSWSAPLRSHLFGGLFLRPPWNMEATERLALDNQLWRGWKTQFISPLFLGKQPLEQEMTVDVLIFKRWAPRSLRLHGRICSNVTELPTRLSSPFTTTAQSPPPFQKNVQKMNVIQNEFIFKCKFWKKSKNVTALAPFFSQISVIFTSSAAQFVRLYCRAPCIRQADGAVPRGPVLHNSPGWHYKHLAPLAPVIHVCLLPSNRTHRKFASWRNNTTNNYRPTPFNECIAHFKNPKTKAVL